MTAFYASRKPPGTIGAARKHVIPYQKYGAKAQQRASRQQRELETIHAMARDLCAKLAKGSK